MLKSVAIALYLIFAYVNLSHAAAVVDVKSDDRIKYYHYREDAIYRLDLALKSVTAIQFGSSEMIESIIIGDSTSWEVVKLKAGNVVSIKPLSPEADTNMTIYTDRHVYSFELHSRPESRLGVSNEYRTVFTYPVKKKPKPVAAPEPIVNSDYLISGKAKFRPRWIQDNGRQTKFFLERDAPRPAVFKVGPNGTEELVNSRTKGDTIIVDGTSEFWVLRIGDERICVGREGAVSSSGHRISVQK